MKSRKYRGQRPPFNMPTAEFWVQRSRDTELHLYLRVAFVAYSKHGTNGHARMTPGLLRESLTVGGQKPEPKRVSEAIKEAVRRGWLMPGSCAACLIVPGNVEGGPAGGKPTDPCSYRVHAEKPP